MSEEFKAISNHLIEKYLRLPEYVGYRYTAKHVMTLPSVYREGNNTLHISTFKAHLTPMHGIVVQLGKDEKDPKGPSTKISAITKLPSDSSMTSTTIDFRDPKSLDSLEFWIDNAMPIMTEFAEKAMEEKKEAEDQRSKGYKLEAEIRTLKSRIKQLENQLFGSQDGDK